MPETHAKIRGIIGKKHKISYLYSRDFSVPVGIMEEVKNDVPDRQMAMLRQLINLAYTCTDKELFYHKFRECIHIASLKKTGVLDVGNLMCGVPSVKKLSDTEIEMYCLMQLGFSPQEMAVVCGEKSINAIYIRRHRLLKKLKGRTSPEVVWGMAVFCMIVHFVLLSFNCLN